jgi:hypothetical protein
MASIGGVGTVGGNQQISQTELKGKDITGSGNLGENGPTPDLKNVQGYTEMMAALGSLLPQMSGDMVEVFLAEITAKMKESEDKASTDKYKSDQEAKRTELGAKKAKIDEAEKKIQESIDKRNSGNIFDIIGLIFQAIAAALAIVLGALLSAVCPVAGALLIAAGVVGIVMMIDSAVQMATGLGIAGNIAKAAGASPEECAKADMGFRIAMAIVGIALAIAAAVVTGGASFAGAVQQLSTAVQSFQKVAQTIQNITTMASAANDIVSTAIKTDAAVTEGEAKKLQAKAMEKDANIQLLEELIDMSLQRLIAAGNRFNEMMDMITDMIKDKGDMLSNAKFTG